MVDNLADGILTTCSRARIFAFIADACEVGWTIRIQYAFRAASFIGISSVVVYA